MLSLPVWLLVVSYFKPGHKLVKMRLTCLIFLLVKATCAYKSLVALEEDSKGLSRHRRFIIPSQTGWSFTVRFTLKFPLEGLGTSMDMNVPFPFSFDLATLLGRKKRDVSSHFTDRLEAFKMLENYMPSLVSLPTGVTSHDCILRAICEVARTPANEDGIMGDMVNLLLTPSHVLDKITVESDYLDAQRTGHFFQNCEKYENKCPLTLFECIEDDELDVWSSNVTSKYSRIVSP